VPGCNFAFGPLADLTAEPSFTDGLVIASRSLEINHAASKKPIFWLKGRFSDYYSQEKSSFSQIMSIFG